MSVFLITGGAGFIGSNFCNYMVSKYPDDLFVCIDSLTYASNIKSLDLIIKKNNFIFLQIDICDEENIYILFNKYKFDYVINFAAESHVDRSISDPSIFLRTNVIGTQVLLDSCKKYGVKKFHQISTDEVYGDLPLDTIDSFKESSNLNPSSPYSASKASADLLVLAYFRTYNLPVSISRCSNNYGPYQHLEKLIPLVIHNAINDISIPIYGSGENIRDWLYVVDHVIAIDLIVRQGKIGHIYNIGGCNEISNINIVEMILDILGKPKSLIKYVPDRLGHDLKYSICCNKIKEELGFEVKYSFDEYIRNTIKWYIDNQNWIKK